MATPTLTFNPSPTVALGAAYTILDSAAIVNDGGNTLGTIRITLGPGIGSLGVVSGGTLTTTGTIGAVSYLYESAKRLLSLTGSTATGADFTQVLKLVGYNSGSTAIGVGQIICVSLGSPLYSTETGHYYELISGVITWNNAKNAAASRNFFGLTGYLATVTSQAENNFLELRIGGTGILGGSSFATAAGTIGSSRVWKWETGPETGQVFWDGASTGLFQNWFTDGNPKNSGQPSSTTNLAPYLFTYNGGQWYDDGSGSINAYYVEYSTASGTGNDGLSGTRSVSTATVQSADAAVIAALVQATTAIEVYLTNGAVTSTIGVPMGSVTIGAVNATHIQVSINLGINTGGKRRQAQGFRIISGSERELIATRTRVGEVYNFVFLKTVDGSSSVTLLLK